MSSVGLRGWWSTVRDTARTQLWPLPTVAIVLALGAGVLLPLFRDGRRAVSGHTGMMRPW